MYIYKNIEFAYIFQDLCYFIKPPNATTLWIKTFLKPDLPPLLHCFL